MVEMDINQGRGDTPQKMNAKEPFNDAHEAYFAMFSKKMAEESLNCGILQEIDKVINIHTEGQRC